MKKSRIRVKFCGMTRKQDIVSATDLGVDAIGLIFYPESPRYVTIAEAKKLLADQPPFVDHVAVLVNPEAGFVEQLLDELPVQWLQFHGHETPGFCEQFKCPYIKAIAADSSASLIASAKKFASASALLFDTPSLDAHGGTGRVFDWNRVPETFEKAYILAGGLTNNNVVKALEQTTPFAIDVCSGVEKSPGVKDYNKMNRFIKTLRGMNDQ